MILHTSSQIHTFPRYLSLLFHGIQYLAVGQISQSVQVVKELRSWTTSPGSESLSRARTPIFPLVPKFYLGTSLCLASVLKFMLSYMFPSCEGVPLLNYISRERRSFSRAKTPIFPLVPKFYAFGTEFGNKSLFERYCKKSHLVPTCRDRDGIFI